MLPRGIKQKSLPGPVLVEYTNRNVKEQNV